MTDPTIVTREQWGADETGLEVYTTTWAKRTGFYTHYSAGPPGQSVRTIQDHHLGNGWGDIGYNWLVNVAGTVYEGRRGTWSAIGAHAANNNTANIGVCFIGRDADVTDAAKQSIRWLYDEANRLAKKTLAMRYHSMTSATECPGDELRAWVIAGMPATGGGIVGALDEEVTIAKDISDLSGGAYKVGEKVKLGRLIQVIFDRANRGLNFSIKIHAGIETLLRHAGEDAVRDAAELERDLLLLEEVRDVNLDNLDSLRGLVEKARIVVPPDES